MGLNRPRSGQQCPSPPPSASHFPKIGQEGHGVYLGSVYEGLEYEIKPGKEPGLPKGRVTATAASEQERGNRARAGTRSLHKEDTRTG